VQDTICCSLQKREIVVLSKIQHSNGQKKSIPEFENEDPGHGFFQNIPSHTGLYSSNPDRVLNPVGIFFNYSIKILLVEIRIISKPNIYE